MINIQNDYNQKFTFNTDIIKNLVSKILSSSKFKKHHIDLIFTKKEYLSKLKKEYFKVDQFTDVIAFNLEDENEDIDGEIYISIDNVLENSKLFKTSFNNEFSRVFIHGILHLLGYDDNNKKNIKIMRALEDKYLLNLSEEIINLKC